VKTVYWYVGIIELADGIPSKVC